MSSNFSSTKAYRSLVKSQSHSAQESSSRSSTSAREHPESSRYSSKSSFKNSSKSTSKASAKSSSKPASETSSKHSIKSFHKHKHCFTLSEISANIQSHEDSSQSISPAIERYVASPTRSNPHYISSDNVMTEAEYEAQMRTVLDSIATQLDLSDTLPGFFDSQVDEYETQLELDEDEFQGGQVKAS